MGRNVVRQALLSYLKCQRRRGVVATLAVLLGFLGTLLVLVPIPAQAAAPLKCDGSIYAQQYASPNRVYEVNRTTGALTEVAKLNAQDLNGNPASTNALALTGDGKYLLAAFGSGGTGYVFRHDMTTGVTTTFNAPNLGASHGAINLSTGIYYFGTVPPGSPHVLKIYGFDVASGTFLGLVAEGTVPGYVGNGGDFAFDQYGNLYAMLGAPGNNPFYVIKDAMPTTVQPTPKQVTLQQLWANTAPNPSNISGIAFGGSGELYISTPGVMYKVNPVTGTTLATVNFAFSVSVDMASCSLPALSMADANIDRRFESDDEFTVTISDSGGNQLASGSTADPGGGAAGPTPRDGRGDLHHQARR